MFWSEPTASRVFNRLKGLGFGWKPTLEAVADPSSGWDGCD